MVTVTHRCGHTQDCRFDELGQRAFERGLRTEAERDEFIASQRRWLECNLCPPCYCAAKEADPNTKPMDPPTPISILQGAALAFVKTLAKN